MSALASLASSGGTATKGGEEAMTAADVIEVDLDIVRTPMELHDLLSDRLRFPSYYGRNWDAFWDCITDPEQSSMPKVLRLRGWAILRSRLRDGVRT